MTRYISIIIADRAALISLLSFRALARSLYGTRSPISGRRHSSGVAKAQRGTKGEKEEQEAPESYLDAGSRW